MKVISDDVRYFNGNLARSSAGRPDDLLLLSRVHCGLHDNLSVTTRYFRPNLIIYSFIPLILGTVYTLISLHKRNGGRPGFITGERRASDQRLSPSRVGRLLMSTVQKPLYGYWSVTVRSSFFETRVCVCVCFYYTPFSSVARGVPYLLQGIRFI